MVKSPKVRHSKQRSEPVTIDLSADEVKREDSKAAGAADDKKPDTKAAASSADETAKASAQASSSAASRAGASGAKPAFGRDGTGKPEPAKKDEPKAGEAKLKDEPKAKPAPPPMPPRRGGIGAFAAAFVGGAVALAGAGGLYLGGYLPTPQPQPPVTDNSAVERLEAELASLREEIAALQAAPPTGGEGELGGALAETNTRVENMAVLVEEMRAELGRLSDAVASGGGDDEAALATLSDRLSQIEQKVAELPVDGGNVQAVTEQVSGFASQLSAMQSDLAGLSSATQEKFAALDASLTQLSERLEEQGNDPGVALAIAASALKAAIDRGQPFAAELETFARLAPDAPEIAALRELAATGVPTAAAIAAETDSAARAMIAADQPDNANAGLLDRLWSSAESLITVRPIGAVEGDDVPAVVARMEVSITNGDYAGAVAEYETLPDAAKAAGADFIAKVKARGAADQLVAKVLADALRA
ncbi:MAG: phage tail protein [Rhizobiaceae bacterium]|nr:phage tail protein [Rhizobiaceae bacterium]